MAKMRQLYLKTFEQQRLNTFVSCWHSGLTDNDAMWRLYGAEKDGSVCIKTTVARLENQMPRWIEPGRVEYVNYNDKWQNASNAFVPFFKKRSCFDHEREVRFLFNKNVSAMPNPPSAEAKGYAVPFDPQSAILQIYVSPTAPSWFLDVVSNATTTLGLKIPVDPAPMSVAPTF